MSDCLDDASLAAIARGELPADRERAIDAHVESCTRCARRLARLPIGQDLLAEIQELEQSRRDIAPAVGLIRSRSRAPITESVHPTDPEPPAAGPAA